MSDQWERLADWCAGYESEEQLTPAEVRGYIEACCALAGVPAVSVVVREIHYPSAQTMPWQTLIVFHPTYLFPVAAVHEAAHWVTFCRLGESYMLPDGWYGHGPEWMGTFRWLAKEVLGMSLTKRELRAAGLPVWRSA